MTVLSINGTYQEVHRILAKVVILEVEPVDNVIRCEELAVPHQSHHDNEDIQGGEAKGYSQSLMRRVPRPCHPEILKVVIKNVQIKET